MNTNTPAHKAKIRHLCSFLALCLHLAYGAVPGPCKYSVTEDHLLNLRRLVGNQLQNGCSISYNFTERQSLSDVCYIKAAFPHILDLLNTHFRYGSDSDNYKYTSSLKNLIYNIYSQKCIPPINEEIEDNPVKFAKLYMTSPREGLEKAEEVIQMYKNLVTKNDKPVRWNCEDEFAEDLPESSTTLLTQMSGTQEYQCSCTKMSSTPLKASLLTRPSPSAPITMSPPRSSLAPVFKNTNEKGYKAPETGAKQEAPNSVQMQSSPDSKPSPGLSTTTELFQEEPFLNHVFSITPDLTDGEIESSPLSAPPSPVTPSTKPPRIRQKRTVLVLHSATSQPPQRSTIPVSSDKSTAHVLSQRSLETKNQGILSDFYSELLQSWITTTTSDPAGIHEKDLRMRARLQITPGTTANNPFQTLHVDKKIAPESSTALPSMIVTEDSSEYFGPPAEQSVSTPTHIQTRLHMAASVPEIVIKAFSEAKDGKESKCQKNTEDTKTHISRNHVDRPSGKDFQLTDNSINAIFIMTSVCISAVLLLTALLLLCKQERNIRLLFQRPREIAAPRSIIYDKIDL